MNSRNDPPAKVVAKPDLRPDEPDSRTPTQRLLDRITDLPRADSGWADEHDQTKRADIEAQNDKP
jgi:hypothetical protein